MKRPHPSLNGDELSNRHALQEISRRKPVHSHLRVDAANCYLGHVNSHAFGTFVPSDDRPRKYESNRFYASAKH